MLDEADEVVELDHRLRAGRQRRGEERRRRGPFVGQVAGAVERDAVEAPRVVARERAGDEVVRVEGLEGVVDDDGVARSGAVLGPHRAVHRVQQLADGDGRRALGVRALVAAGVGDQEPVARRHEGVEEELAVLRARVALADARILQSQVVAVARRLAREDAVVQAEQAHDAVGHRSHRHERAEGQVARPEVGSRGAALEALVQEGPDLREGQGRAAGRAGLLVEVAEQPVELVALPGVALGRAGQELGRPRDRSRPPGDGLGLAESGERVVQTGDELGQAAGQVDRPAVDVVEWQDAVHQAPLVLVHRHAHEDATQPRGPGALLDLLQPERRAAAASRPQRMPLSLIHSSRRARSSSSRPKRRRTGSWPARSRTCEAATRSSASSSRAAVTPSTGLVWRSARSASRTRRSGAAAPRRLAVLVGRGGAEGRVDERRERLDVRAHDDDVARLEGRVLAQEMEDRVAHDLHLARAAVTGVDLDAAVARGEDDVAGRRLVGAHVGLDARQHRVGGLLDRVVMVLVLDALQDDLHLARVAPPRGEQPVDGNAGRRVVLALDVPRRGDGADLVPQRGGGVQQEQVQVAPRGERLEDVAVARGKASQPEDRDLRRELDDLRLGLEHAARPLQPLRGPRFADARPQAAPELPLPLVPRPPPPTRPTRARCRAGAARTRRRARPRAGRSRTAARA